jgi:P pilus assembly chaperone PapD
MIAKTLVFASCAFAALALASSPAVARIEANPAVYIFEPGTTPEAIVTVTSSGANRAFVTTRVREVMERGEIDELLREDPDPATMGLIATPGRMVLEAGERRGVRIVPVGSAADDDRVWRVLVSEVAGAVVEGQSGVAFLLAYDILVIQRPENATVAISGARSGTTLALSNAGNSFGMIAEVRLCLPDAECVAVPNSSKRLYAGKSWSVELPSAEGRVEVDYQGINRQPETLTF